jgi:hypothetical protein
MTRTPDDQADDPITVDELRSLFGEDAPNAGLEVLFPGLSKPLNTADLRTALRVISTEQMRFRHRLIENAFSWALQDCNYLNPKYMNRLIAETLAGMKPEQAAEWNATLPKIAVKGDRFADNDSLFKAVDAHPVSLKD